MNLVKVLLAVLDRSNVHVCRTDPETCYYTYKRNHAVPCNKRTVPVHKTDVTINKANCTVDKTNSTVNKATDSVHKTNCTVYKANCAAFTKYTVPFKKREMIIYARPILKRPKNAPYPAISVQLPYTEN